MQFDHYKAVLYPQQDASWVAEIPAISGCYALMPTREAALVELSAVSNSLPTNTVTRDASNSSKEQLLYSVEFVA